MINLKLVFIAIEEKEKCLTFLAITIIVTTYRHHNYWSFSAGNIYRYRSHSVYN